MENGSGCKCNNNMEIVCCKQNCPGRDFKQDEKDGLIQLLFNVVDDLYEENNLASMYPDVVNDMKPLLPEGFCVSNKQSLWDRKIVNFTKFCACVDMHMVISKQRTPNGGFVYICV